MVRKIKISQICCELGLRWTEEASGVYLGENTCVYNSLFEGKTYVGKGVKIDNFVHVGQNCVSGDGSMVARDISENALAYGVPANGKDILLK